MTELVLDTASDLPVARPSDRSEAPALARSLAAVRAAVTVATLLRTLGAAAIVGSLSLFLLQGFDARGDLSRVHTLLGQSGLLALAGLGVGFALREPKGARVFLALALVSVPANFAILGAMIYSIAPLDGGQLATSYPAFAVWQANTLADAWRALGVGLVVLVPITAFAFAVLDRHRVRSLALALLAGSATLLVPIRLPSVTIIAAGVVLIGVVRFIARARLKAVEQALPLTFEKRLAHALLLLPPGILLGRTMLVHGVDVDSALPVAMAAWYLCQELVDQAAGTVRRQRLVAILGAVSGIATAALAMPLLVHLIDSDILLVVFATTSAMLCRHLMQRADEPGARRAIGALWCAATLGALGAWAVLGPSLSGDVIDASFIGAIAVALLVVAHGIVEGRHRRTSLGGLAVLALLGMQADALVALVLSGGWRALAGIGVVTVVAGSLLERFGPVLKLRFEQRRGHDLRRDAR